MITALPNQMDILMDEGSVYDRNDGDFISKNKGMPEVYREFDWKKRQLSNNIREVCNVRAKFNRLVIQEQKRQKVMNYMGRWDEYRVRREAVVQGLLKDQRKKNVGKVMIVLGTLVPRLQTLVDKLQQHRDLEEALAKEEVRR